MTPEERAKDVDQAERNAFLLLHWAKQAADNGHAEKASQLAQAAVGIAQAVALLKSPAP
ncbi:hypothetical protein [Agrobacterium rubi]|uniref:hypothetical protein n=1 Tax=Agrobacterium rubi TaxID=28099 RepID=UPI00201B897D|nr:hypothetical protein [Agrobacterium rubi]